jgi:competence protein ComFC
LHVHKGIGILVFKKSILYWLESSFWNIVDLVFPPTCPSCQEIGFRWCEDCQRVVRPLAGVQICQVCGAPSDKAHCKRCKSSRPSFVQLRSWVVFRHPIRSVLHSLKYQHNIGLGQTLAWAITPSLKQCNWPVQEVVPIPLSEERQRERGYNQAGLIARPTSQLLEIDYRPNVLRRARHTRSQVGLTIKEREKNVQNAFEADPTLVAGKNILLMDDVCTTGATLTDAARALSNAGAREVYAFTIARALSHADA